MIAEALELSPNSSSAHFFLGIVQKQKTLIQESVAAFQKSIELNPSNAHAYAQLGHSLIFLGRAEEAEAYVLKAIKLSPRDPMASSWYQFAGQAAVYLGNYESAIGWLSKAIEIYPKSGRAHVYLAVAHLMRGDEKKAVQAARAALKLLPSFSVERFGRLGPTASADPRFVAQQAQVRTALAKTFALAQKQASQD